MTDETDLQITLKERDSSLVLSKARSDLVARGRKAAAAVVARAESAPPASLSETQKLAEQGNAAAQFNLGSAHYNGQGVTQDYAEAALWYRRAADQGDAKAQFILGLMYDNGQGVAQDYNEAIRLYRNAAENGNAAAMNNLG